MEQRENMTHLKVHLLRANHDAGCHRYPDTWMVFVRCKWSGRCDKVIQSRVFIRLVKTSYNISFILHSVCLSCFYFDSIMNLSSFSVKQSTNS